ncbi:MAG TPA: sodium-independent anion transporter [Gammaproteobacteria bacterium]|nr:sodium-independent anion transporter [Gammaproteobacteria bacterium]
MDPNIGTALGRYHHRRCTVRVWALRVSHHAPKDRGVGTHCGRRLCRRRRAQFEDLPYISVLRKENPLFFVNSSYFENTLLERMATKPRLKPVVVDCEAISDIDVTCEQMLRETALRLRAWGTEMLFACAKGKLQAAFIQSGLIQQIGEKLFFQTRAQALEYAWQRRCNNHAEMCAAHSSLTARSFCRTSTERIQTR